MGSFTRLGQTGRSPTLTLMLEWQLLDSSLMQGSLRRLPETRRQLTAVTMAPPFPCLYSSIRPFGATSMLGSWSKEAGAQLYCIEPSGTGYGYWGCAAGKAKSAAKTELEKIKMTEMTCAELIKEAAKIIYQVHDEVKDKMFELELSWVGEFTDGVHKRVPEEVLQNAEKFAKSAL